tara:strand:+ start:938 stop:1597 length:660 start_codon:yes stop_codon:yes gene_type:complete
MKRRKKTIILVLAASITTFYFSSCGPDDPKPHYTVSQETKDYCVFQNDTRWIYEEENTKLLDTLTVYQFEFDKQDYDNERVYTNDIYIYRLKSSILGYGINYFYRFFVFPEYKYGNGEEVCHTAGPYTRGLQPIEYFDGQDTGTVFQQYVMNPGIKYVEFHDSLKLLNKVYNDVKVFEYIEPYGNAYPQKIYWSKNIGRIRYELFNGEIWNLKEYSINQ